MSLLDLQRQEYPLWPYLFNYFFYSMVLASFSVFPIILILALPSLSSISLIFSLVVFISWFLHCGRANPKLSSMIPTEFYFLCSLCLYCGFLILLLHNLDPCRLSLLHAFSFQLILMFFISTHSLLCDFVFLSHWQSCFFLLQISCSFLKFLLCSHSK